MRFNKAFTIIVLLLICSCTKELDNMNNLTITFVNVVKESDVWLLKQTEDNLKTTLWGKATISKTNIYEQYQVVLTDISDDNLYLIRMIDEDKFYYEANGVVVKEGYTIRIKQENVSDVYVEILDEKENIVQTMQMFVARL